VNAPKPVTFAIRRKCTLALSFNRIISNNGVKRGSVMTVKGGKAKKSIKHS